MRATNPQCPPHLRLLTWPVSGLTKRKRETAALCDAASPSHALAQSLRRSGCGLTGQPTDAATSITVAGAALEWSPASRHRVSGRMYKLALLSVKREPGSPKSRQRPARASDSARLLAKVECGPIGGRATFVITVPISLAGWLSLTTAH